MADPFPINIEHVQDGEPISASVTGRATRELEERSNYLRDRLDASELGENLLLTSRTLDSAVLPGQAVFYNTATARFEQALASVTIDLETGALIGAPSTLVVGIVIAKANPTLGDVLLLGAAPVDLTLAVDGTILPGCYYLSSSSPGKLVQQKPPVSVYVLFFDGTNAYVNPNPGQFLESHTHYRFKLTCRPSGTVTPPSPGFRHTITTPDTTRPGWLPASHAIFAGKAPVGAHWGYNLAEDESLSRIWPPTPISSAVLFWDKGQNELGGTLIPLGLNGVAYMDRTTIWWMSDCYGDVPWPINYTTTAPQSEFSVGSSAAAECPRAEEMELVVSFTEMLFATDKSVVTSLQPATDSPIVFRDCNGNIANRGDLFAALNFEFLVDEVDETQGSVVLKGFDGTTFHQGHVVEGIKAGANVDITGTFTRVDPADSITINGGIVTIDVQTNLAERELFPQIVRLVRAKERLQAEYPYIGLSPGVLAAIEAPFFVPAVGLPLSPKIKVRLVLYGTTTGTLPVTALTCRRLPRPSGTTPVTLPLVDTTLTCNTNLAIGSGQYLEVESDPIDIAPGDSFLLTFTRAGNTDGYAGEVGLFRISAVVIGG